MQRKSAAQLAMQRRSRPQDPSKHGNFDANDLCRRLELHKTQEKLAKARRGQANNEQPLASSCPSTFAIPKTQSQIQGPYRKPHVDGSRFLPRANAAKMGQRTQLNTKPGPTETAIVNVTVSQPPYVPQQAAAAFAKTTTADGRKRRSLDVDNIIHDFGRRSLDSVIVVESQEKVQILSGSVYDNPRNQRWAENDECSVKTGITGGDRAAEERRGLRVKFANLRLLSSRRDPDVPKPQILEAIEDRKASRQKSMIFSMFK